VVIVTVVVVTAVVVTAVAVVPTAHLRKEEEAEEVVVVIATAAEVVTTTETVEVEVEGKEIPGRTALLPKDGKNVELISMFLCEKQ
jgi:hypothetical protein